MTSTPPPSDLAVGNPVRVLRTAKEYEAALSEYEQFFDVEPQAGSAEGDRFEMLGLVLAKYESEYFPIDDPDPAEVIRMTMEGRGYTQADLARLLGLWSRASEVLARKRDLTLDQIRRLRREWRIPADSLIGEPRSQPA